MISLISCQFYEVQSILCKKEQNIYYFKVHFLHCSFQPNHDKEKYWRWGNLRSYFQVGSIPKQMYKITFFDFSLFDLYPKMLKGSRFQIFKKLRAIILYIWLRMGPNLIPIEITQPLLKKSIKRSKEILFFFP